MMALEAALSGVADSKLRRFLAHNALFSRADVEICGSALCHKAADRKNAPIWGAQRRFWTLMRREWRRNSTQTFKMARHCVLQKVEAQDVGSAEWDPASVRSRVRDEASWVQLQMERKGVGSAIEETGEDNMTGAGAPDDSLPGFPRREPVPDSPSLSVQVPSSPPLSVHAPPQASSVGRNGEPSRAPHVDQTRHEGMWYVQVHALR